MKEFIPKPCLTAFMWGEHASFPSSKMTCCMVGKAKHKKNKSNTKTSIPRIQDNGKFHFDCFVLFKMEREL